MLLERELHPRLALLALLIILLLGISISTAKFSEFARGTGERPNAAIAHQEPESANSRSIAQWIGRLQSRTPTPTEFQTLVNALEKADWQQARQILQVIRRHDEPHFVMGRKVVLQRLARYAGSAELAALPVQEWRGYIQITRELLTELKGHPPAPRSSDWDAIAPDIRALAEQTEDGVSQALALQILADRPPSDWQRIVLHALDAPSISVRAVALGIIQSNGWRTATPRVLELASSAWPEIRDRSLQIIEAFGIDAVPAEYGNCVVAAAARFANQVVEFGADDELIAAVLSLPAGSLIDLDAIKRGAESYLDEVTASDARGPLWLAVAARAGQRKLTLRLWEHEIARVDSDGELVERGLESLARDQLLAGLSALRDGNRAQALKSLATVSRIKPTNTHSSIFVYAHQARQLATEEMQIPIGNGGMPSDAAKRLESGDSIAVQVLGTLDITKSEEKSQAEHNLDRWCGLESPSRSATSGSHYQPLAN